MHHKKKISTDQELTSLNREQKKAVLTDHTRVLVLAGAGAGKTKTILEKIKYLIQNKNVRPQDILAITFTKNAAYEMIDRLIDEQDNEGNYLTSINNNSLSPKSKNLLRKQKLQDFKWIGRLTIKTFHSICYTILKKDGVAHFDNKFKLLLDDGFSDDNSRVSVAQETKYEVVHKLIIDQCKDPEYLLSFKKYIIDYLIDRIHAKIQQQADPYLDAKKYTTLNGEKVRSKSEQYISDWLFRHNIHYEYEPEIQVSGQVFHPDFFIPAANIYLEHVSNFSKGIAKKKSLFNTLGKTLEFTYENQMQDSNLINMELTKIVKDRLPSHTDYQLHLSYEEEFKSLHAEVRQFIRQLLRVIDIFQVDQITEKSIRLKLENEAHERVKLFYNLAIPILKRYKQYLREKSYLDFNSIISETIKLLELKPEIQQKYHEKYRYVLVDEFQDVNKTQVLLIRKLMNPEASLFCVGDDWQSIYGFRGSDVQYVVNFSRYFKDAQIISLRKNYRSTPHIVNASNEVISYNKNQIHKDLISTKKSNKKIQIYAGIDQNDNLDYVVEEIKLLEKQGVSPKDILFLYRRSKMYVPYRERFRKENIEVQAKTIHAAKGLESKIVFIVGMTEGRGGFPDIWLDDRIYYLLRPLDQDVLMEEERRLFYVALTRARDHLYLITELGVESSFINEIPDNYKISFTTQLRTQNLNVSENCPSCNFLIKTNSQFKFCPNCGFRLETQLNES